MERQVQAMGRQFVSQLCTSLRGLLQPYWSLLLACQLTNPLSARYMPDSSRAAAKDLCIRAGMTERKAISVVEELDRQRDAYRPPIPAHLQQPRDVYTTIFCCSTLNVRAQGLLSSHFVMNSHNWFFRYMLRPRLSRHIFPKQNISRTNIGQN